MSRANQLNQLFRNYTSLPDSVIEIILHDTFEFEETEYVETEHRKLITCLKQEYQTRRHLQETADWSGLDNTGYCISCLDNAMRTRKRYYTRNYKAIHYYTYSRARYICCVLLPAYSKICEPLYSDIKITKDIEEIYNVGRFREYIDDNWMLIVREKQSVNSAPKLR